MKRRLLHLVAIATICTALQSCNFVRQAQSYVERHCPKTQFTNPLTGEINIHYECDSLWRTERIKGACEAANICIDISNGRISGNVRCDSVAKSIVKSIPSLK